MTTWRPFDSDSPFDEPLKRRPPPEQSKQRPAPRRSCDKVAYPSAAIAYLAAKRIRKRCLGKVKTRAYRCRGCHCWHLTHVRDRESRRVGWVDR